MPRISFIRKSGNPAFSRWIDVTALPISSSEAFRVCIMPAKCNAGTLTSRHNKTLSVSEFIGGYKQVLEWGCFRKSNLRHLGPRQFKEAGKSLIRYCNESIPYASPSGCQ